MSETLDNKAYHIMAYLNNYNHKAFSGTLRALNGQLIIKKITEKCLKSNAFLSHM